VEYITNFLTQSLVQQVIGFLLVSALGYALRYWVDEHWHDWTTTKIFLKVAKELPTDITENYPILESAITEFKYIMGREPKGSELATLRDLRDELLGKLGPEKSDSE